MSTELERFLGDQQNRRLFEQERLILEFTEAICALMNEQRVTRAELARRLGCSPSNVTQILDGENNFTVRTVAECLFALGARMTVATEPLGVTRVGGTVETVEPAYEILATDLYSHAAAENGCTTLDYPRAA